MRILYPVSARPFPATIYLDLELNQTPAILSLANNSNPPSKPTIPSHTITNPPRSNTSKTILVENLKLSCQYEYINPNRYKIMDEIG